VKRFLLKGSVFIAPFLLYLAAIYAIDPFERFQRFEFVPAAVKRQVAMVINEVLWKVVEARRAATPNITLGSSKMGGLTPELLKDVTGKEFEDLSLGGGSANEMANLFWLAAKTRPLRLVLLGLNIQDFNYFNNRDRVIAAEATAENPLLYLSNRDVMSAAWSLVMVKYRLAPPPSKEPNVSRAEFWRSQMTAGVERDFVNFRFDAAALARFAAIAKYCKANGIELTLIVLPNHAAIHARLGEFGAEQSWQKLPAILSRIAETYDFDADGPLTQEAANFTDPFHFDHEVARQIAEHIWQAHLRYHSE
jgi:hypothetical protein